MRSGLYYVTGLSNLFTATLLRFPQSLKGVMVSKCDKPLEPLSTCPTYYNSFYPLQLFLPTNIYRHTEQSSHKLVLYQRVFEAHISAFRMKRVEICRTCAA